VRLYTGPGYQLINAFLRSITNLTGEYRREMMQHPRLTLAATVTHVIAAIRKLAAVSSEAESHAVLWRGVRGQLPRGFWTPDEQGMVCAVDMAFMSTSRRRQTPIDYMGSEGADNVLWVLKQSRETDDGYHSGADISMLSQFEAEKEILFPPATMLKVQTRVANSTEHATTVANSTEHATKVANSREHVPVSHQASGTDLLGPWHDTHVDGKRFIEIEVVPTFV